MAQRAARPPLWVCIEIWLVGSDRTSGQRLGTPAIIHQLRDQKLCFRTDVRVCCLHAELVKQRCEPKMEGVTPGPVNSPVHSQILTLELHLEGAASLVLGTVDMRLAPVLHEPLIPLFEIRLLYFQVDIPVAGDCQQLFVGKRCECCLICHVCSPLTGEQSKPTPGSLCPVRGYWIIPEGTEQAR